MTILDDESKADLAQQLATQLVGQNVAAIIGGTLSPSSEAIARVANDAKILQVYLTPTVSVWKTKDGVRKYTFEATPQNKLETVKLFAFMKGTLHTQKLAVMHDDQLYGTQGALVAADQAKTDGVNIVDDESYAVAATDVTPQLQKVRAAGADTILIYTGAPTSGILVRQVRQYGITAHLIGTTGIVSDNFLRVTGKDGDGVYADMDLDRTYPNDVQKKLLVAYRAAYNAGAEQLRFVRLGRRSPGGQRVAFDEEYRRRQAGGSAREHEALSRHDRNVQVHRVGSQRLQRRRHPHRDRSQRRLGNPPKAIAPTFR